MLVADFEEATAQGLGAWVLVGAGVKERLKAVLKELYAPLPNLVREGMGRGQRTSILGC